MTLIELKAAVKLHAWDEDFAARTLLERHGLIEALLKIPEWQLVSVLQVPAISPRIAVKIVTLMRAFKRGER